MQNIILSLTTYYKRWNYFNQSLKSILAQSLYNNVFKFIINIDDDSPQDFINKMKSIENIDSKIEIKICDSKWRVANKLIPTYINFHDDIIICFDDDKNYPIDCLKQLLNAYEKHNKCIIAQEINPAIIDNNGNFIYLNSIDIKLEQEEFGKYLSNACLFPPNCFSSILFDYEKYSELTNCKNDEVWFWIASTLNKTKVVGLNNTLSYGNDNNVTFSLDETALTHTNKQLDIITRYNSKLNEWYGNEIKKILSNEYIVFKLNKDNILAFTGNLAWINFLYKNFNIKILCDKSIVMSWMMFLTQNIQKYKWTKIEIYNE